MRWTTSPRDCFGASAFGLIGPALFALICFDFKTSRAATAFIYLIFLAVLSLMGSIAAPMLVSIAAAACLDHFSIKPLFDQHATLFLAPTHSEDRARGGRWLPASRGRRQSFRNLLRCRAIDGVECHDAAGGRRSGLLP
jgi:hypothetical protein